MAAVVLSYLARRAEQFYVNKTYQFLLLNVTTTATFGATASYNDILPYELTSEDGGYSRIEFTYASSDIVTTSSGIRLKRKTARFVHDNSQSTLRYTHYAIVERANDSYYLVKVEAMPSRVILTNGMISEISTRLTIPTI